MDARKIRVLVLGGTWPAHRKPNEAADLVAFEFLRMLVADGSFAIAYAPVAIDVASVPSAEPEDLEELSREGVVFHSVVKLAPPRPAAGKLGLMRDLLVGRPDELIPGAAPQTALTALVRDVRPDVILTVWSEIATAATYGIDVPTVSYHGDPEPEIAHANALLDFEETYGHSPAATIRKLKTRFVLWGSERAHLTVMRSLAATVDVSATAVNYYRARGVKRIRYVPCLRTAPAQESWRKMRDEKEQTAPLKIVGSVGALSGTGNTYAFLTLGREVIPQLSEAMRDNAFELHIFGGGSLRPCARAVLQDSHVRLRGFVDDLDTEILSSPIFLIAHNRGPFKVAYSRVLHAWSLGACIVAFHETAEAMPEMKHNVNALLAETPAEMAQLIALAGADARLRRRLGEEGIKTLRNNFDPASVVGEVAKDVQNAVRGLAPSDLKRAA